MSFSAPSPHLLRFEPALFRLKHSSVGPRHKAAGRIQKSAERKMRRGLCALRKKNKKKTAGGGLPGVPCDLQESGSYFHHAGTSPHWPCNGATHLLDWLPRLKTPPRSWSRLWESSLAGHASASCCAFAYIPESLAGKGGCCQFDGGHEEADIYL